MDKWREIQDFPAEVCITQVEISALDVVGVNASPWTLAKEVQVYEGQGWAMRLAFKPMSKEEAAPLEAFLKSLRGRAGRFRLGDPACSAPAGLGMGSPVVVTGDAGDSTVLTAGWEPGLEGQLLPNDYVEIGGRLYSVIEPVNAATDGSAEVCLWPRLRADAASEDVVVNNLRAECGG